MTRTEVLDVFRERYVATAYAKGLKNRAVILKHVLRNSLILIVVMTFMMLPWIVAGAIIVENIFQIPGMGTIMIRSILTQDFPVMQASILIISVLTVGCSLLSDIVGSALDPRIRNAIGGGVSN